MRYQAREANRVMIDHLAEHRRAALFAEMGLGKTSSALTAMHLTHEFVRPMYPALVLAPLRVARSVWPKEILKWDHLSGVRCSPILGTAAARLAAMRVPAEIYTLNYENVLWLRETLGKRWPFRTVIADESTALKSFRLGKGIRRTHHSEIDLVAKKSATGGKRARALGAVAHHTETFWELTGTPAPNGLKDLWGQLWMLDRGARLGTSHKAFMDRWFDTNKYTMEIAPRDYAADQIQHAIRDLCLSLRAADYLDVKEPLISPIEIELPPKARRIYDQMEKEYFAKLGDGTEIEAFTAAAKSMTLVQLAAGAVYTDKEGAWKEVHTQKLDAVQSVINEAGGRAVMVAYWFKSDLARLTKAFPQGRVFDSHPSTENDWNAGKIPLMFVHPQAAGHGSNLQDGGHILTRFTLCWSLEYYEQVLARIGPVRQLQSGYDRIVYDYPIVAKDTIDEQIMLRQASKASVQQVLMQALKARKAR